MDLIDAQWAVLESTFHPRTRPEGAQRERSVGLERLSQLRDEAAVVIPVATSRVLPDEGLETRGPGAARRCGGC
jgi:hypothetical protein